MALCARWSQLRRGQMRQLMPMGVACAGLAREILGIADPVHVLDRAAHRHGQPHVLRMARDAGPVDGAREDEELAGVGHLDELRHDAARHAERGVHVEARAGATILREVESRWR
jgi:hypothetical protein